jgi:hypothetical protein
MLTRQEFPFEQHLQRPVLQQWQHQQHRQEICGEMIRHASDFEVMRTTLFFAARIFLVTMTRFLVDSMKLINAYRIECVVKPIAPTTIQKITQFDCKQLVTSKCAKQIGGRVDDWLLLSKISTGTDTFLFKLYVAARAHCDEIAIALDDAQFAFTGGARAQVIHLHVEDDGGNHAIGKARKDGLDTIVFHRLPLLVFGSVNVEDVTPHTLRRLAETQFGETEVHNCDYVLDKVGTLSLSVCATMYASSATSCY